MGKKCRFPPNDEFFGYGEMDIKGHFKEHTGGKTDGPKHVTRNPMFTRLNVQDSILNSITRVGTGGNFFVIDTLPAVMMSNLLIGYSDNEFLKKLFRDSRKVDLSYEQPK